MQAVDEYVQHFQESRPVAAPTQEAHFRVQRIQKPALDV
jgi:hypothetical protein